jgi:hypothetical protein
LLRFVVIAAAALVAAGCACAPVTPALFVVVPGSNGHVGKIVVSSGSSSATIDSAYGAQRVRSDGRIESAKLSESEVRSIFGPTMAALPGKPTSYTLYFLEGKDELTEASRQELERVFHDVGGRLRAVAELQPAVRIEVVVDAFELEQPLDEREVRLTILRAVLAGREWLGQTPFVRYRGVIEHPRYDLASRHPAKLAGRPAETEQKERIVEV